MRPPPRIEWKPPRSAPSPAPPSGFESARAWWRKNDAELSERADLLTHRGGCVTATTGTQT
jgi:hypothetical protein